MDEWHQPIEEMLPWWISFLCKSECVAQLAYWAAKGTDLNLYLSILRLIIMNVKRQIET